jgi:hypothetical protein
VYIATPDFELVYKNLNQSGMVERDIYLRLSFVDDAGATVPVGDPANDYRIPKTSLRRTIDSDGIVTQVWFEVPIDTTTIPDGYWEIQAVVHNEYEQQGNVWHLRVRLDHTSPDAPTALLPIADQNNESIHLSWVPGSERDRKTWILERQKSLDGYSFPDVWTTVAKLPGTASSYDDVGSISGMVDPWGDPGLGITNYYEYRLWAVDLAGNQGPALAARESVPSAIVTTSTTTVTTLPTTSTTGGTTNYAVTIQNHAPKVYDITVTDSASKIVYTGQIAKNGGSIDVNGLAIGAYSVRAIEVTQANPRWMMAGFALPDRANQVVLDILP